MFSVNLSSETGQRAVENMLEDPLYSGLSQDEHFIQTILRKHENDDSLEVVNLETTPGCDNDKNYISSMTRIQVTGTRKKMSFNRNVLMKRQPTNSSRRESFGSDPAFRNEVVSYKSILPSLNEFSKLNLPFPDCVYASPQLLILEDVQQLNYKRVDRLKGLDLAHSRVALQALGKFHGTSLAMKHEDYKGFSRIRDQCEELIFAEGAEHMFGSAVENSLKMALKALEVCKGSAEDAIEDAIHKMSFLKGTTFRRMQAMTAPVEPLSVICHGDFWTNNMLFRYNGDEVEEVTFVDLQVMRYSSPVTDISYFLSTSLAQELYIHQDELIKAYHESLLKTMRKLAPSAPPITLEEIQDQMEQYALYGLLMGFLLLPAVSTEPDSSTDNYGVPCQGRKSNSYLEKIKNLVLHYIGRGYI